MEGIEVPVIGPPQRKIDARLLVYDVSLRPDFFAQVVIPRNLTALEARRIGSFLLTLAVDVDAETLARICAVSN
jgi:hypothetical protein